MHGPSIDSEIQGKVSGGGV